MTNPTWLWLVLTLVAAQSSCVKSYVRPAVIGADGLEFTQVQFAQSVLGLTGEGMRIAILDDGVDWKHSSNWGRCSAVATPNTTCRVVVAYNPFSDTGDTVVLGSGDAHGTHVAGIAAGAFPYKLLDANNTPFRYQRGVAYKAFIGDYKIIPGSYANTATYESIRTAISSSITKAIQDGMDILNLSYSQYSLNPSSEDRAALSAATAAGVLAAAAAGNDGAKTGLFATSYPSYDADVMSVAMLGNTVTMGALLNLSSSIPTGMNGMKTSQLAAIQRADTPRSVCYPRCNALGLPLRLAYGRFSDTCYDVELVSGDSRGAALLIEVPSSCGVFQPTQDWYTMLQIYDLRPKLVLFYIPAYEEDAYLGSANYEINDATVPVLWLANSDGAALAAALADADGSAAANASLQLTGIVNVGMPVAPGVAMQPSLIGSRGPGLGLQLKPDIAAPGFRLYSSTPSNNLQTLSGTSMATPHTSGVLALWKQSRKGVTPTEGWAAAAKAALKNTAKPIPYSQPGVSSNLMWPPAFVGAGTVQAAAAITNCVSISPAELLLQSGLPFQIVSFNISNNCANGSADFMLLHQPAFALDIVGDWSRKSYDPANPGAVPSAAVQFLKNDITLDAGQLKTVEVSFTLPPALLAGPYIYSGYITLKPKRYNLKAGSVPLSIPYQGCSRNYSDPKSVRVIPPLDEELTPVAAALCAGYLDEGYIICSNDLTAPGVVKVPWSNITTPVQDVGLGFTHVLARPLQQLIVEVYGLERGNRTLLGSLSFGPCQKTLVRQLSLLPMYSSMTSFEYSSKFQACGGYFDGSYTPLGSNSTSAQLQIGKQYKFKLVLVLPVAEADRAAGQQQGGQLRVDIRGVLEVTE